MIQAATERADLEPRGMQHSLDEMIGRVTQLAKAGTKRPEAVAAIKREFPDATEAEVEAAFDGAKLRLDAADIAQRTARLEAMRAEAEQDLRDLRGETMH
jgi:hypothetical protein